MRSFAWTVRFEGTCSKVRGRNEHADARADDFTVPWDGATVDLFTVDELITAISQNMKMAISAGFRELIW